MCKKLDTNSRELPDVTLRAMEPEDLDVLYTIENDMELWDAGNTISLRVT